MARSRVYGDVKEVPFGPSQRFNLHLRLVSGGACPASVALQQPHAVTRTSVLQLRYTSHSLLVALDLSPSLFLLAGTRCEIILLETLALFLFRVRELRPRDSFIEVSVILTGLSSGFRVAVQGHPLASQEDEESILRLTETLLEYVVTLRRTAKTKPSQQALAAHLTAGAYCLRLRKGLPTLVVISDCTWGAMEVGQYGDVLMDLQLRDVRVVFIPIAIRRQFGFVSTLPHLRFVASSTGGLVVQRASDLDARLFCRTSKLQSLDKSQHHYRANTAAGTIARLDLAEYPSVCDFQSVLKCRTAEGFYILQVTEDSAAFYRHWTQNADLQVVVSRADPVTCEVSVVGEAGALQQLREGSSTLRRRLTTFLKRMRAFEDLIAAFNSATPSPAPTTEIERLSSAEWVSLLCAQGSQWAAVRQVLSEWSTKQWESQYFREDGGCCFLARIDLTMDCLMEIVFVDLNGQQRLQEVSELFKSLQVQILNYRISIMLVEEPSGRRGQTKWKGLASCFMRSLRNSMKTNCEAAAQQLAFQLEMMRREEGFWPISVLDRSKRLYLKFAPDGLLQYLIAVESSQVVTSIHFDPTHRNRQTEETLFHEEAAKLTQRDAEVYACFSHFRFLQWRCLQTLTRDEGGEERYMAEGAGNCSVFRILMRTLGAEGTGHLRMVSETDYLRCFFPCPPSPDEKLTFFEKLYALLESYEGSESALSWASFLASVRADRRMLWVPAACDLPALIPAAFESASDYAELEQDYWHFARHISATSLLVWRMPAALSSPLPVDVFLYSVADPQRDKDTAEVAWALAEGALHAALSHYTFDELFRQGVSTNDLTQTLSLCSVYEVIVPLSDVALTLNAYGEELKGGLDTAVAAAEEEWTSIWQKHFNLHEARTVFFCKTPTQLLFMRVAEGVSTIRPLLRQESIKLEFFSHSSHGFSSSAFRPSLMKLIETLTSGLESLLAELTLELLRVVGRLDTGLVARAARCLSAVPTLIESSVQLRFVQDAATVHLQKELASVLSLRAIGAWYVLVLRPGFKSWIPLDTPMRSAESWDEVDDISLPFWLLVSVEAETTLHMRAVLPRNSQRLTPDSLRQDFARICKKLEMRVSQRILLAVLRETGVCSNMLFPQRASTLEPLEIVHSISFPVHCRLTFSEAHAALMQAFAIPPFFVSNRRDVYRLMQGEDCFVFRLWEGPTPNLIVLDVFGVATVSEHSATLLYSTGMAQLRQVAVQKIAAAFKGSLSADDIALISADSHRWLYTLPDQSALTDVEDLLSVVFTEVRANESPALNGRNAYLYVSPSALALIQFDAHTNSDPETDLCPLSPFEVPVLSLFLNFTVNYCGKLNLPAIEEKLRFCVYTGIHDHAVSMLPERLSPVDWYREFRTIAESCSAIGCWQHWCRLTELRNFRKRVAAYLRRILGHEAELVHFPEEDRGDGIIFECSWLTIASSNLSSVKLYADRAAKCSILITTADIEVITYNLSEERTQWLEASLKTELSENLARREKATSAIMQKLGCLYAPPVKAAAKPSPVLLALPALRPISLTEPLEPLSATLESDTHKQLSEQVRLHRRKTSYEQAFFAFDSWRAKHRVSSQASLVNFKDTRFSSDVLAVADRYSHIVAIEKRESVFMSKFRSGDEALLDFQMLLLRTVADLIREKAPSFDVINPRRFSATSGQMRRVLTVDSGLNTLESATIHLKRIVRDSLVLISVSMQEQWATLTISCLECVEKLKNSRETVQMQDPLRRDLCSLRSEQKLSRLLVDAESQIFGEAMMGYVETPEVNLFDAGLKLDHKFAGSAKYTSVKGRFAIDLGEVHGCAPSSVYEHIRKHSWNYEMNSRAETPPVLFQARGIDSNVISRDAAKRPRSLSANTPERMLDTLPDACSPASTPNEVEEFPEVFFFLLYREAPADGKKTKTVLLDDMPSGQTLHIEYQVLLQRHFRETRGLKRTARATLSDVLKRAKNDILRELNWTEMRRSLNCSVEALKSLVACSLVADSPDERAGLLEAERGVFTGEVCEYLQRVYGSRCRTAEDQDVWHILVLLSAEEIVYVQVLKTEGRVLIKQLLRRERLSQVYEIDDVIRRIYHWLWLQLVS